MTKLQELQERRIAVSEQLTELAKAGFKNADERQRFDTLQIEAKGLGDDIGRIQAANQMIEEMRNTVRPPNGPVGSPTGVRSATERLAEIKAARKLEKDQRKLDDRQERAAFRLWGLTGAKHPCLRSYELSKDSEEVKRLHRELRLSDSTGDVNPPATGPTGWSNWTSGMGIGTPVASLPTSVFVPQGFVYDIENALKAWGKFIENATELATATGAPLPYPTSNDVSVEAEIIGEGATASQQDVYIGNIVLQAWKYDTKIVPVSLELLQDSAFDMEKFLVERFAIRLARGLTRDFTNGNGNGCPRGIMQDATLGATAIGAHASGNNSSTNYTEVNSIGTTDLLNLIHSVDPLYRINGKFMMHDLVIQVLEQLLDNFGRPLFIPNPQTGKLESIFGYPIVMNQYMGTLSPSPAATVQSVVFGDLKKYVIRKVKDLAVLRLVERAAEQGLVLFIGFARYDGRLIDAGTHPVKYLLQPSS